MKIHVTHPLTRVEGDSQLVITRKKNKQFDVAYRMPTTRDFQNILIGQQIEDLPKIVPRICGICPIAHRVGAVKALEANLEITPPPIAELLRELAFLGEIIRSHTYSVFFSTLPDLMYLARQVSRQDILGAAKTQTRILPVATKLYRAAENLTNATAGNTNMGFNIIIGGVRQNLTVDQQQNLTQTLHSLVSDIQWAKEYYSSLLSEVEGEIQHFTLLRPLFISSFDTTKNQFSGTNLITLLSSDDPPSSFPNHEFPHRLVERSQAQAPTQITYSALQHPTLRILAGPHARLAALHGKTQQEKPSSIGIPNLFYAGLLRLDEIEFSITNALRLLESEWNIHDDLVTGWQPQQGIGASSVEAPRGTLLYYLEVGENATIKDIQILVPTELNALALVELTKNIVSTCEELGWTTDQTVKRVQMGIRCFDPCVSCATHTDVRFRD